MPYSDTDQTLLTELQAQTLEPQNNGASVTSTQWAIGDFLDAINQAQNDWLRDSGMVVKHIGYEEPGIQTGIGVVPQTEAVPLPQDCIDILRAAWIAYGQAPPPGPPPPPQVFGAHTYLNSGDSPPVTSLTLPWTVQQGDLLLVSLQGTLGTIGLTDSLNQNWQQIV